jgi:hypothetical protein
MDVPSETVEAIRFIVNSHAWLDFFEPALKDMREACVNVILDPSKRRQEQGNDDYLRGCAKTIDDFLNLAPGLIAEADAEREREEQTAKEALENANPTRPPGPFGG